MLIGHGGRVEMSMQWVKNGQEKMEFCKSRGDEGVESYVLSKVRTVVDDVCKVFIVSDRIFTFAFGECQPTKKITRTRSSTILYVTRT